MIFCVQTGNWVLDIRAFAEKGNAKCNPAWKKPAGWVMMFCVQIGNWVLGIRAFAENPRCQQLQRGGLLGMLVIHLFFLAHEDTYYQM